MDYYAHGVEDACEVVFEHAARHRDQGVSAAAVVVAIREKLLGIPPEPRREPEFYGFLR